MNSGGEVRWVHCSVLSSSSVPSRYRWRMFRDSTISLILSTIMVLVRVAAVIEFALEGLTPSLGKRGLIRFILLSLFGMGC